MNFTREPIIETIITPKDGFKLVVRNSKGKEHEEYSVDAVEIVSFAGAIFYRSTEKPKAFLLPTSDFEVVEVRETKVSLKSANIDKTIKIAGGKESSKGNEDKEDGSAEKTDKKKRRSRRKKTADKKETKGTASKAEKPEKAAKTEKRAEDESSDFPSGPSHVKSLIPPPSTLISETISRYKVVGEEADDVVLPESVEQAMNKEQEATDVIVPTASLDPIWSDNGSDEPLVDNELKDEPVDEPIKLASSPKEDEPIGKTHVEERLEDEDPIHSVSESDDQK